MKSLALGAAIGAVVVFVWGFLFWAAIPLGSSAIQGVENQAALQQTLTNQLGESGVYQLPFAEDPSNAEFQTLHKQGPIATIYFRSEGSEPMAPSTFVMGYLHELLTLLVMGLAVKVAGLDSYGSRVLLIWLAGTAGSLLAEFSGPIWWLHPWNLATVNVVYQTVAWLLAGLVMAGFIGSRHRRSADEV